MLARSSALHSYTNSKGCRTNAAQWRGLNHEAWNGQVKRLMPSTCHDLEPLWAKGTVTSSTHKSTAWPVYGAGKTVKTITTPGATHARSAEDHSVGLSHDPRSLANKTVATYDCSFAERRQTGEPVLILGHAL